MLPPLRVLRTARIVLEREGYAPRASAEALAARLSHRPEHLVPAYVPTLRPSRGETAVSRQPKGGGEWSTPIDEILAAIDPPA